MSSTIHALDLLAAPQLPPEPHVCVLFGDERFLKVRVLQQLRRAWSGDEVPVAAFEGENAEWRDVKDELSTVSLFGGGRRLVVLTDADDFVSEHRQRLEDLVAKPSKTGTLLLTVDSWASNTRLYKAVDSQGLQVECAAPAAWRGKTKVVDEKRIVQWLQDWGTQQHAIQLQKLAAQELVGLVGPNFGMLDQSLAKLALYVPADGKITAELVREVVGGWRAQTTWDLADAIASGNASDALRQLDRLLQSGEDPLAIFGPLSWSLRRFAAATRIFARAQREGRRIEIKQALSQAGVRDWPTGNLAKAEQQLLQLGRERAGHLYRALMEIDAALKGTHSTPDRARFLLEQFFTRLDQRLGPRRAAAASSPS